MSFLSSNLSVYAVPVYYFLSLIPHVYAVELIKSANNGRWDNSNPHSVDHIAKIQKSVPAATYTRFQRAEACHKNGMENLALFIGAVVIGNLAKLPTGTLNATVGIFVALRILYTLAYVNISTPKASFLRTALWAASSMDLIYLIVRAGNALA